MSARPIITCHELIDALGAYLAHEVSPQVVEDFERHLRLCDSCVAYIATYEKTIVALRGIAEHDDALLDAAPAELIDAIVKVLR